MSEDLYSNDQTPVNIPIPERRTYVLVIVNVYAPALERLGYFKGVDGLSAERGAVCD